MDNIKNVINENIDKSLFKLLSIQTDVDGNIKTLNFYYTFS